MDAEGLSLLLRPEGWALLAALPPYDERLALALGERLRAQGRDPALVAAAMTQSRLRSKAREKLGDFADGMLFTQAGLEQATRLAVAAHHARRYRDAGAARVADLTCGIGADSLAFAGVGLSVLAVEVDEATAAVATVNLRHFPEAQVRHADALHLDLAAEGVDAVYADPARRRRTGGRLLDPSSFAPPLDQVLALRGTVPSLGVKLGPGLAHDQVPDDAQAQWVSVDGDVVEVGLWFGPLAPEGPGRSALLLRGHETHVVVATPDAPEHPGTGPVGGYLYEPDGAVIRAGLVTAVAAGVDGGLVDEHIAYVTSDAPYVTPFARSYQVLEELPYREKALKAALVARGVGPLTIKKRGVDVVPDQLRKRLGLRGDVPATIVLTRVAGKGTALLVRDLPVA